ncbi:MAG: M20 family metallopeptidase [Sedimentibacter sp.]|uniref:M20 metallopeptidase family protein n=1 Tax=Sedimentibacter sp. TaxID=1960295 RepID=UPI0031585C59
MLTDEIKKLCNKYLNHIIDFRHQFHMYPELGHKEFMTAKAVADELRRLNIEVTEHVSGTGVIGILRGRYPGRTILLRADMDALPIRENADVEYKSKIDGVMHACAHDGHTASLLGAAMILSELRDQLHGSVKFVFQPDEEYGDGAKSMIEGGILHQVDAAFGLHLWGAFPEGQVKVKHGPAMAAPDKFMFKVIGKGGHGSTPHLCVDPVMITVQAINNMQSIISRRKNTFNPAVISFCSIKAESEYNTIPEAVEVTGTIRTFDPSLRLWIIDAMEQVLKGTAECQGAKYEFAVDEDYALPPVVNDYKLTDLVQGSAEKIIGKENVEALREPLMAAEDFAYFSQAVPSSFFFVGISLDSNEVAHHSPDFQWNDKTLCTSASVTAQIAVDFLNEQP